MKPGRNEPCPCGSGRKYKSCCLGRETARPATTPSPRDFDAQIALGRALLERGSFPEAVDCFRRAVGIQPGNPVALFHLGDTLRLLERFAEAEGHLRRVLASAPDFVEGLVSLADTLAEQGASDEAARSPASSPMVAGT